MDPRLLKDKVNQDGAGGKNKNRSRLKKNKSKAKNQKLTFVGANCAGLNSKLKSFDHLIKELIPSVIFLQETKYRKQGNIKAEGLKNYQVYQLVRK